MARMLLEVAVLVVALVAIWVLVTTKRRRYNIEILRGKGFFNLNTLRSLLPLEFVKGNRSASDHLSETVNYINHLQKSIKELQGKRNKLRTLLHSNSNDTGSAPSFNEGTSTSSIPSNVSICISKIGLEIQISCGKREEGFRLSEALKVLLEEGACVVCSVSGSVDGIFHHNIQCQVGDNIDLQRLLQRLYDVV